MLNCQFCLTQLPPLLFTKCCKASICQICCEKIDKKTACHCGRQLSVGRKNYHDLPQIIEVINKYTEAKGKECDRCDLKAEIECQDCRMVYCLNCNLEVHAGLGFAKHQRRKKSDSRVSLEKMKKKQVFCLQHGQIVIGGCECGAALCVTCSKQHKQICPKGFKSKTLKQFKEDYYLNMLLKMRQLTFFKEKLIGDREKYTQHFKNQQVSFQNTQKSISQQFEYLAKLIQIKYSETKKRIALYWKSCQQVYTLNLSKMCQQIKKFDSYAQLLPFFTENLINLDFFQKKIKRFVVPLEFVNIRSANIEQTQSSIMSISVLQKPWEQQCIETIANQNFEARSSLRQQVRLFGNLQFTGELVSEYIQNPSKDRQINLLSSHSQIYFSFIHLPFQNLRYQIEYGVGMKIKGQQIFKKIANTCGFGIIENLNSNTKYRIRMRIAEANWGTITQITTLDIPRFNLESSLCAKQVGDNCVQLGRGAVIYGSNQVNFGIHRWIIQFTSKNISYQETETACMSVGVSNKQTKKATFAGTTLNYGYQKSQIVLKILLDCNEKRLVILNCTANQEQSYQNLPNFPLFPTIQNKGNAQILVRYNLATDDLNFC